MSSPRTLRAIWLGTRPYGPVHDLQERLFEARRRGAIGDTLLLLEHTPVVTRGRGARPGHVLASVDELRRRGVDCVETGRGGDVTLHAPGQLVAYPIFDLSPDWRDVRRYVRALAEVMRRVAAEAGIGAGTLEAYIGLWADAETPGAWPGEDAVKQPVKLGAIGVRISRWITMHGFALNLDPDLGLFRWIVPCGIREHGVTSVARLVGDAPSARSAAVTALVAFQDLFRASCDGLEDLAELPLEAIEHRLLTGAPRTAWPERAGSEPGGPEPGGPEPGGPEPGGPEPGGVDAPEPQLSA